MPENKYAGQIVPKFWGYEWCAFDNGAAAVWILHIAKKRKTSLHCHPNKKTTLVVLKGVAKITLRVVHGDVAVFVNPLERVVIDKGMYHQTEAISTLNGYPSAEDGLWLMEIEEPSDKGDLVRAEDNYGRAGQPYETEVVPYSGELLKLAQPGPQRFMGYLFSLFMPHALKWQAREGDFNLGSGVWLNIQKDKTMKLSHYVADFIAAQGIRHVFAVSGGGSMHLVDSIGNNKDLTYVANHHEQASAFAAEAYARLNGLGCGLFTTGPGGTNAITGVASAWIDSIPLLCISGQVTSDTLLAGTGVRQFGVQESDIVTMVKSITKYAVTVKDPREIKHVLEKAVYLATHGRKGPVWVDIPLDIQSKQVDPDGLLGFNDWLESKSAAFDSDALSGQVSRALAVLAHSKRPVMIVGHGIRLAGAEGALVDLINVLGIPVVTSWTAADMVADHPLHIGHCGIFGDRASNFAVQNADCLLVIGCRLSVPQMGYRADLFAREAKIIMVDIDANEVLKPSLRVHSMVVADAGGFIREALGQLNAEPSRSDTKADPYDVALQHQWVAMCQGWRAKYPVFLPEYRYAEGCLNSFHFIDALSEKLPKESVVVLDQGTAFTCTFQTARMKLGQRWIAASGHAPMGWGLPGAIGAHYATGQKVICIVGDGDLQMNIQELQTIVHNKLPIIIFVMSNGGYLTIKHMQINHFSKTVGSGPESGVSFPDVSALAIAYKMRYYRLDSNAMLEGDISRAIYDRGPCLCEVIMSENQPLIPRVSSKKLPDGSVTSSPIEDLFPFLPRDEFLSNMIVPAVNILDGK